MFGKNLRTKTQNSYNIIDFKIPKLPHHYWETITITVTVEKPISRISQLNAESTLGTAYLVQKQCVIRLHPSVPKSIEIPHFIIPSKKIEKSRKSYR